MKSMITVLCLMLSYSAMSMIDYNEQKIENEVTFKEAGVSESACEIYIGIAIQWAENKVNFEYGVIYAEPEEREEAERKLANAKEKAAKYKALAIETCDK
jgi:hypothetical protein